MKQSTLIYLGVGVGAVAYYMWYQNSKKNKEAASSTTSNQTTNNTTTENKPTETCKEGFELKEIQPMCKKAPCPTIKSCVVKKGNITNQPVGLDKEALFNSTIVFRGGVPTPPEIQALQTKNILEAQARIDQLGLRAEYNAWYIKRQEQLKNAHLPS